MRLSEKCVNTTPNENNIPETISKLTHIVTPAETGVQNPTENLDSGFRWRNDD